MSEKLGRQIVVDNRGGASGRIGAEIAAKATPDGYTIFLGTTTLFAMFPNLDANLPYDVVRDFASITQIAFVSNVLVVNPSLPATSVAQLLQLAKMKPDALNYASAGMGSPAHLAGEMLNLIGGVRVTHVPYKGAGPALIEVIAGSVQLMATSPIAAGPHIASGKLRALATTGAQRNPAFPNLPTVGETLPGYEITQWWGLSAPARTPEKIIAHLHDTAAQVIHTREFRERLSAEGAIAVGGMPQAFDAFIVSERQRLGDVIRKAGIKLDR
jgi:tripartite-type tricarboxylate transporter receptor subunit TctC